MNKYTIGTIIGTALLSLAKAKPRSNGSTSLSCPLRTKPYGGIPGSGGFGCDREYNVAAQRYFEAAHCLLGSLGRVGIDENWTEMRIRERGHIKEEIGIMMYVIKEYKKQVYLDQFNPNRYRDTVQAMECNRLAIKDIQTSSPLLIEKAKEEKRNLLENRSTIPNDVFTIANLTYSCIILTAETLLDSVKNNEVIRNAWADTDIHLYTNRLNNAIEKMYE